MRKKAPITMKTRDRVLSAAIEEFIEFGFYGARMQRIADRAKVNKAMLFYYARLKERARRNRPELIAARAMREAAGNVENAKRGYDIALDKYDNGRMTNVDVLDSQVALAEARVQYLKALYDRLVAQTEFERAAAFGDKSEQGSK